jgi:hypothetical protein
VRYPWSTSVRLPEHTGAAIEEIAAESRGREDLPDLSQSETLRRLVMQGLEDDDGGLLELLDPATRILLERENFKQKEGDLNNLRSGFETKVKRVFEARFKNGMRPEQLRQFSENMREDVKMLWPDWYIESVTSEAETERLRRRRRECLRYVDDVVEAAAEAAEASEWDPLDPEEIFSRYAGVEAGERREAVESGDALDDGLVHDAMQLLRDGIVNHVDKGKQVRLEASPREVVGLLAERVEVSEAAAVEAVDRARGRLDETRREPDDAAPARSPTSSGTGLEVDDAGMVAGDDVGGRGLGDEADGGVEPPEEAVSRAETALEAGKAPAVVPVMVRKRAGVDEAVATAARDEALDRRRNEDGEGVADD